MEEKRKEEIPVVLPGRIEVPPDREKTEEEVRRKEERKSVIRTAHGVGALISGLTIMVGIVFIFISVYLSLSGGAIEPISAQSLPYIVQFTLMILGIINITSGLLLMGSGEVEER